MRKLSLQQTANILKVVVFIAWLLLMNSIVGCSNNPENKMQIIETGEVEVFAIDSCEYVTWSGYKCGGIVHKQNCKFCIKRNKK